MKTILEDKRPIQTITIPNYEQCWQVGQNGVTRIKAYEETGQCAYVPWLAIYRNDTVITRINCASVESICYVTK